MALKGTLKDFGIADILQLIGQQQKTGTLLLKAKDQEVHIGFKDGSIVKAESSTRKRKELIGQLLVEAELISQRQLDEALETQKRTLKRLGDVIVGMGLLSAERFAQIAQLQATETLYRLFRWKSGTYAFEQGEIDYDAQAMKPLRAESVLMEGFRMMDEWPFIQRQISRYDLTFEKLKPLPVAEPEPEVEKNIDDAFDDAFAEEKKTESKGEFASLGESERRVYGLVAANRNVRKLIALSTMGEFETCKALCNLVNLGYLSSREHSGTREKVGGDGASTKDRLLTIGGWTLGIGAVVAALAALVMGAKLQALDWVRGSDTTFADPAVQRFLAHAQLSRIGAALDMYRLENGELPTNLEALVSSKLLNPSDVRYPWRDTYYYRRVDAEHFVLLPPLR